MRADFQVTEGRLTAVSLSGDFFCYPPDALFRLESELEGKTPDEIEKAVETFYASGAVETPGIERRDWIKLLKG